MNNQQDREQLCCQYSYGLLSYEELASKLSEEQMWAIFHSTRKKHKQKSARNRKRSVANGTKMAKR